MHTCKKSKVTKCFYSTLKIIVNDRSFVCVHAQAAPHTVHIVEFTCYTCVDIWTFVRVCNFSLNMHKIRTRFYFIELLLLFLLSLLQWLFVSRNSTTFSNVRVYAMCSSESGRAKVNNSVSISVVWEIINNLIGKIRSRAIELN